MEAGQHLVCVAPILVCLQMLAAQFTLVSLFAETSGTVYTCNTFFNVILASKD